MCERKKKPHGTNLNSRLVPSQTTAHLVCDSFEESEAHQLCTTQKLIDNGDSLERERRVSFQMLSILLGVPEAVDDARGSNGVLNRLVSLGLQVLRMVHIILQNRDRADEFLCNQCHF